MSETITDFDRKQIAQEEYTDYGVGDTVKYKDYKNESSPIGTVTEVVAVDIVYIKLCHSNENLYFLK